MFIRGKEEDDFSKVNYFWANEGILSYVKISIRDTISGISGTNKNRIEITMMNETKNIEKHISEVLFLSQSFIFSFIINLLINISIFHLHSVYIICNFRVI